MMMKVLATDGDCQIAGDPDDPMQVMVLPGGGWMLRSLASVMGRPGWMAADGRCSVPSEAVDALNEQNAYMTRLDPRLDGGKRVMAEGLK